MENIKEENRPLTDLDLVVNYFLAMPETRSVTVALMTDLLKYIKNGNFFKVDPVTEEFFDLYHEGYIPPASENSSYFKDKIRMAYSGTPGGKYETNVDSVDSLRDRYSNEKHENIQLQNLIVLLTQRRIKEFLKYET